MKLRIAKGGATPIATSLLAGVIFMVIYIYIRFQIFLFLSLLLLVFTSFSIYFFRDPERKMGEDIVSPADGTVRRIDSIIDDDIGRCVRISIFMNLFNVHVNRMPIDGKILKIEREKGYHHPAYMLKSEKNEKNIIVADTQIGKIKILQIVGFFARRIVCYVKEGDVLKKGERIGIIRFGSRVDLLLPADKVKVTVNEGQHIRAGVDTVAKISD